MNLLLFEASEVDPSGGVVRLAGRRAAHLRRVLNVEVGRELRAGIIAGPMGIARVESLLDGGTEAPLELSFLPQGHATPRPTADLLLALPRPKGLRRLLAAVAAFGVGELSLLNAWRVDKSYFSSPLVTEPRIRIALVEGLEQGVSTWLPEVVIRRRFVEALEALPPAADDPRIRVLLEPGSAAGLEALVPLMSSSTRALIAIGPEGGWIERELNSFRGAGFRQLSLGTGVLRTEGAVPAALAQWALLRRLAG